MVRAQTDAQPAFWIYTGSLAENSNTDVTLGWAASSSRDLTSGYNGQNDVPSNRTNAQFTQHITGSDSFDLKEGEIMIFFITNQANNSKAIRVGATIYGEKA